MDAPWRSVSAHLHRSPPSSPASPRRPAPPPRSLPPPPPRGHLLSRNFKYAIFGTVNACVSQLASPSRRRGAHASPMRLCVASFLISGPGDPPYSKDIMKSTLFREHPHPSPRQPHTQHTHTHDSDQMATAPLSVCLSLSPLLSRLSASTNVRHQSAAPTPESESTRPGRL